MKHIIFSIVVSIVSTDQETYQLELSNKTQVVLPKKKPESAMERMVKRSVAEKQTLVLVLDGEKRNVRRAFWPTVDKIDKVHELDTQKKQVNVVLRMKPTMIHLSTAHPNFEKLQLDLRASVGKKMRLAVDPATSEIEALEEFP